MRHAALCVRLCQVLIIGLSIVLTTASIEAGEMRLDSLVVRGGLSGSSVIGAEQNNDFSQIDLAVTVRLPWEWQVSSGWVLRPRLLTSAGVLRGAQETNGVFTLLPIDVM